MQAIELATTISMQGGIVLPANFKTIFGREARMILLLEDPQPGDPLPPSRSERQAKLQQALDAVAQAGIFAHIADVSDWQRDIRADRTQPGRED